MPSFKKDRVIIVTGAGQGICRAVAERFAEQGARVAVVDLLMERAQLVADAIAQQGGTALALECDVASTESVTAMVKAVLDAFGSVDVLVNGAGGYRLPVKMAEDITDEVWDLTVDSNLKGTFLCCRAVLPYMREQKSGHIINFASNAARFVANGLGAEYTAAKTGVLGLTRHIALQYAKFNVLANTIAPGPTRVERLTTNVDDAGLAKFAAEIPLGRLGEADEHAEVVLFLASVTFMTGATIDNNGGLVMV